MPNARRAMGRAAGDAAAEYLSSRGFAVLYRNWYGMTGELDIVCRKEDTLHVVEVRCRRGGSSVDPAETLTARKLASLEKTAREFLYVHGVEGLFVSLDLICCREEKGAVSVTGFWENVT
ncbi:MAG: YraN family protein [Abditibacteriota bacterium]|nr:YraN family protein [Abditibacteriota bacterium]